MAASTDGARNPCPGAEKKREAKKSLKRFGASHKARYTSIQRYATRIKRKQKESRTGVIVIVISRATFVGAFPNEEASNPVEGCSSRGFVRLHRTPSAAAEEELAGRTPARPQSILRATEVEVEDLEGGQEWREMSNSSVAGQTRCWHGECEWPAGRSLYWIERMAPRLRGGPSLARPVASAWPRQHARGWPSLPPPWTTFLL